MQKSWLRRGASRGASGVRIRFPRAAAAARVLRGLSRAILAVWLVLGLELLAVLFVARRELASVWEIQFGTLGLLPVGLVLGALLGVAGFVLWELLRRVAKPEVRWMLVAMAALGFGAVAWGLSGGRHFEDPARRTGFVLLFMGLAGAGTYWTGPWLARLGRRRPQRLALGALLLILGLELANALILVRLYPAFHDALAVLALLAAPALLQPLRPGPPLQSKASQPKDAPPQGAPPQGAEANASEVTRFLASPWLLPGSVLGVVLVLGALLSPAARFLSGFDNFRLVMSSQAPLLGHAVRAAAGLAPPRPLPAADCELGQDCLPGEQELVGQGVDFKGRDVLLISIDALRADHLGAYGYERKTSPAIDELALQGAVFEYAYAPTPHTSYSVTSLMTGKYMRPLLLQGAGADSDTFAELMRTYGYQTAAFYPPAVFFIDPQRFVGFKEQFLGFEYRKVEFADGDKRVAQVREYLAQAKPSRLFMWVHLFTPHEPYITHPGHDFGDRDVDRYDSEVAFADQTVGKIVELFREQRPNAVVILTADHGEEFGEHGGRYHGTSVYEEQVRVPLIMVAPGAIEPRRIQQPVQTIDVLSTVLSGMQVPRPPRLRGRDLGPLLVRDEGDEPGLAVAETEEQSLLAEGAFRLICARKIGACQLFDVEQDPAQQNDLSRAHPEEFERLRERLREIGASHGRYEVRGLRAEGKGWPGAILRGIAGDGDAAPEIAELLEDADLEIRRKASELLFELRRPDTAAALRLSLRRGEDAEVRNWCALALTRLGEGAPRVYELLKSKDRRFRRFAALALAETGDDRGEATLIAWWRDDKSRDFDRSRELLAALGKIRSKDAVWPLVQSLHNVRLRPYIAKALADIGDDGARGALVNALREERYQSARIALAESLVQLGAEGELAVPLVRFLGVPDPLPKGVQYAKQADILKYVGGPGGRELSRLQSQSDIGAALTVVIPPGGNGKGVRFIARARTRGDTPGKIYVGTRQNLFKFNSKGEVIKVRDVPRIDAEHSFSLDVPAGTEFTELYARVPEKLGFKPGHSVQLVVFADHHVELDAAVLVPLADELPPPAPKPWKPESESGGAVRATEVSARSPRSAAADKK